MQKFYDLIRNDDISQRIGYTQAYNQTLKDCSVSAKQAAKDLVTGKKSIDEITYSSKAAAVGMKLLNVAMNFGIMLAIQGVIELGKIIQRKFFPTVEQLEEKFFDSVQKISDAKSEQEQINDELKTTQERIAELEKKSVLSFLMINTPCPHII